MIAIREVRNALDLLLYIHLYFTEEAAIHNKKRKKITDETKNKYIHYRTHKRQTNNQTIYSKSNHILERLTALAES